jgi:hypothetical protein
LKTAGWLVALFAVLAVGCGEPALAAQADAAQVGTAQAGSAQTGTKQAGSTQAGSTQAGSIQRTISFDFDRTGLPVPRFTLVLHRDGTGTYHAEEVERRSADSALQQVSLKQVDRAVVLTPEMAAKIFQMAQTLNHFTGFCGTKAKNIADTGKKTLTYSGPDGAGSCTYNYSDDKTVAALTNLVFGIAYTMDVGRRLDFERRFDRLGLDAELIALEHAVEEKDALELGNIASTLSAIAGNQEMMQRVRIRATKLLEQSAGAGSASK